jgi:aspartokinase
LYKLFSRRSGVLFISSYIFQYMQVLKFGGSSVANSANIQQVVSIVEAAIQKEAIVVVSALGGVTDATVAYRRTCFFG